MNFIQIQKIDFYSEWNYLILYKLFFFNKKNYYLKYKYPIALRRNNKSKVTLNIKRDKTLILSVPNFFTQEQIYNFLSEKESWIEKTLTKIDTKINFIKLNDDELLLYGEKFKLIISPQNKGNIITDFRNKYVESDDNFLKDKLILRDYYTILAKRRLVPYVHKLAEEHNIQINRLFIRDQKTRWGTYSSKKNLSFNFRVILCPQGVIDYLIYHEFSHSLHMNHSKQFWETVESFYPDYRTQNKWLKKYGNAIFNIV